MVRVFVGLGGLLVLALFAALIAPYFIDWSSYRTAFETEAGRIIGQPVKVRGEADARLLPFPSVTFSDVTVGDEADPAMTISRFSMDAELAPFLSGEVLIFDMRVEAPSAKVRILEDGTLDWALKRKPTPPGDLVVLEHVTIQNADITIIDEQNGRTHSIENVNALVSAKSLSGPWAIEAEGEIGGHRGGVSISTGIAQANGAIRMRARLSPDSWPVLLETEGEARIEGDKPHYDGLFTFTALSEAEADGTASERPLIVAKGDFAATNERLTIQEWRAEIGLSVDPYVVTGQATVDTGPNPEFLLLADGQQINMDTIGEEAAEAGQATAAVPAAQRLAVINTLIDRLPPPPLPGRVSLNLPAIVAGDTTLREITLDARPDGNAWLIDGFSANLPGRTTVEARGRLVSGKDASFNGTLTVASTQPSGLANWLVGEVDPVIRRLGAAGFSANVSLTPALQRFEALEVAVGPAILTGRLEREVPATGVPSLSVELSGDTFDVDAVRALALLAGGETGSVRPLTDYNLAARIRADTLTAGVYSLDGFETSFLWRDRRLTVDSLKFADFGGASGLFSGVLEGPVANPRGTVTGQVSAEVAGGLFDLASEASGGHQVVHRLAANSFAFDALEADISLALDPETGPDLTVTGTAGGSTVRIRASGTGLMPNGDGPRTIDVSVDNAEAYRILEQAGIETLPLEGEGPAVLSVNISGGADDGDLAIEATMTSGGSVLALKGNGAIPAKDAATGLFELDIDVADIEPFVIMLGQSLPQAGAGLPVSMSALLAMNEQQVLLSEITGQAEDNGFSGELAFDRSASGLNGSGALRFDRVDLGWLGELALGSHLGSAGGADWSEDRFPPPSSGQPELTLSLQAGEIDLGRGGTARNLTADLTTGSGTIVLDEAEADWFGGRLGGTLSLSNTDGTVFMSARITASDADLAALDRAVRGTSTLAGRAGASVSLEGTGKSIRDLVASLAGGGELAASDLVISGPDPDAFPRIIGAADRDGFEIETAPVTGMIAGLMRGGEIEAQSLRLPFTLTGGVMRFSNAEIRDGETSLAGDGRVDLTDLHLEANWRMTFEPGVEAIAGGDPSVMFGIGGLVVDPAVSIDAGQMTNYLSMRNFERERRKVELLQAGVVEKQRLRREIALLAERAAQREAAEQARAEADAAAALQAEEAARLAEEQRLQQEAEAERAAEAARLAEAEAQRRADEEAEAARKAAEAARKLAEEEAERIRKAEAEAARLAAEEAERVRIAEEKAAALRAAEEARRVAEEARRAREAEAAAAAARLAEELAAELAEKQAEKARLAELQAEAERQAAAEAAERAAEAERQAAAEAAERAAEAERQAAAEAAERAAEAERQAAAEAAERAAEAERQAAAEAAQKQAEAERQAAADAAELKAIIERQAAEDAARAEAEARAAAERQAAEQQAAEEAARLEAEAERQAAEAAAAAEQQAAEEAARIAQLEAAAVTRQNEQAAIRDDREQWIQDHQADPCFYVRVVSNTSDGIAMVGMGDKVESFETFYNDFTSAFDIVPNLQARLLSAAQCPLPDFVTQFDVAARSELALALDNDRITSGETLRGVLTGAPSTDAIFYLIDSDGFCYRIDQFVKRSGAQSVFEIKLVETGERKSDMQVILAVSGNEKFLAAAPQEVELASAVFPKLARAAQDSGAPIDHAYAFFNFAAGDP
ncbi:AsmA-like C-terminal region-containing protein [Hoeflea ulvae]|uniref:AsmA family protein n=1 Tax=Hoeflea ulvae TaxID=2983764 RepID=A0ABT3YEM1_9HYPH|nr:AsmA-like C-terminal region-containing protein [Hoeflea ulvae]MCY0094345.1 AsmA family protein [Hoeflea ulvae]